MTDKVVVGITGAGGYIGSSLCKMFLQDSRYVVKALIHENKPHEMYDKVDYFYGDVCNEDEMMNFTKGVNVLIHTAAKLGKGRWEQFYKTNVLGTEIIAQCCLYNRVSKFVFFSSIEVYGDFNGRVLRESDFIELCGSHYVDSKILGEQRIINKFKNSSVIYYIVRPGMVYGPGSEFWTKRLYVMAKEKKFELIGTGNGNVFPLFIENLQLAIQNITVDCKHGNQIYNLVDEIELTWYEWGEIFGQICDEVDPFCSINLIVLLINGIKNHHFYKYGKSRKISVYTRKAKISTEKAKKYLKFEQLVPFDMGMKACENWLKSSV